MKKSYYILLLFLTFFQGCKQSQAQDFVGSWKGEVDVAGNKLLLVFNLLKNGDTLSGTMESPMQTSEKIPLSEVSVKGDSIFIAVNSIQLNYRGVYVKEKEELIEGQMSQGAFSSKLLLLKSKNETSGITREQDVKPPYPYIEEEVVIENPKGSSVLTGTLTRPKGAGRFPAVVLVNGSGQQNRDAEVFGHRPFKVLADYLTRKGFVVLRYDDRGVGGSKGEVELATTVHFATDAEAAVQFLRKNAAVNTAKIGIIGHSEGGLIAPMVASEDSAVSFLVLLAPPVLRGDSLMILQNHAIGKLAGLNDVVLARNDRLNRDMYDVLMEDKPDQDILANVKKQLQKMKGAPLEDKDMAQLNTLMYPWLRTFLKIDPAYYLKKVYVPIFAEFGGKDIQVVENENRYALQHLGLDPDKVTVKAYPNLNHLMQTAKTGAVTEYFDNPESFNPQLMEDIGNWLLNITK